MIGEVGILKVVVLIEFTVPQVSLFYDTGTPLLLQVTSYPLYCILKEYQLQRLGLIQVLRLSNGVGRATYLRAAIPDVVAHQVGGCHGRGSPTL